MKSFTVKARSLSLLAHNRKPTRRKLSDENTTATTITASPFDETPFVPSTDCAAPEAIAVEREVGCCGNLTPKGEEKQYKWPCLTAGFLTHARQQAERNLGPASCRGAATIGQNVYPRLHVDEATRRH